MIKEKSTKKRPEVRLKMSDYRASQDELWKTARQAANPMDIGPHSTRLLRAWIAMGVGRMETEGRLSPENLAIAENNLKHFIQLMKTEAVFLGTQTSWIKIAFMLLTEGLRDIPAFRSSRSGHF